MQKLAYLTVAMADKNDGQLMNQAIKGLYDRMSSQIFNSAALAQAGTTTKMKTAAIVHGICGGLPTSLAISDNFWDPLAGFVVNIGKTNVFCMYVDAAGAASSAFGVEATTGTAANLTAGVKFPPMPEKKMMVGFAIISGGSGAWTAGTSTFTTATTVTYVTIVNTVGMFDPSATI